MAMNYPEYKVLIVYDILPDKYEPYYRYVLGEFVPALREMGLPMTFAWHVAYGEYPARQLEFICEDRYTLLAVLCSTRWTDLEQQLMTYTTHYQRKLVHFEDRFQF
ncbi:MAG: hypothetical protein H7Y11_07840 [Armatimonadetes bacterium]|nr:hypothetical protein [Anaerolineae bacterium]